MISSHVRASWCFLGVRISVFDVGPGHPSKAKKQLWSGRRPLRFASFKPSSMTWMQDLPSFGCLEGSTQQTLAVTQRDLEFLPRSKKTRIPYVQMLLTGLIAIREVFIFIEIVSLNRMRITCRDLYTSKHSLPIQLLRHM